MYPTLKSDVTSDASGFFEGRHEVSTRSDSDRVSTQPGVGAAGLDLIPRPQVKIGHNYVTPQLNPASTYMLNCAPFFRAASIVCLWDWLHRDK